jgi:hypothetical protein
MGKADVPEPERVRCCSAAIKAEPRAATPDKAIPQSSSRDRQGPAKAKFGWLPVLVSKLCFIVSL